MENNKLLPVSIIILAISITFGSIWIGLSLKELANQGIYVNSQENDVLDFDEAAQYLKISNSELVTLITEKNIGIHYVKINNKYIFSKEGLDRWLQSTQLEVNR